MIAIIKYNAGNIRSVQNALENLGYNSIITDNPKEIKDADKVIFPGVGEASSAMHYLKSRNLDELIVSLKQPLLGICLGLQLMCKHSEEGNVECLGIFENSVRKFKGNAIVPHMGWNNFNRSNSKLLADIEIDNDVYFVHSYYADLGDYTTAICEYIEPFSAVLEKDNFFATQFHPEKSANIGEKILKNFLSL